MTLSYKSTFTAGHYYINMYKSNQPTNQPKEIIMNSQQIIINALVAQIAELTNNNVLNKTNSELLARINDLENKAAETAYLKENMEITLNDKRELIEQNSILQKQVNHHMTTANDREKQIETLIEKLDIANDDTEKHRKARQSLADSRHELITDNKALNEQNEDLREQIAEERDAEESMRYEYIGEINALKEEIKRLREQLK